MTMNLKSNELLPLKKEYIRYNRPKLYDAIGNDICYILEGDIKNRVVVMVLDVEKEVIKIINDTPEVKDKIEKFFNCPEEYQEIDIKIETFRAVIDFFLERNGMRLISSAAKVGRPAKYTIEDAKRILEYKNAKLPIREIAKKEKMSTATVQMLLKKYETMIAFEESDDT